ncbi:RelE/StbE family addiction module toxin [Streptococcus gordonii]|nr:RelE/StbE family addiction module toxin [Streptococcus gordonii]
MNFSKIIQNDFKLSMKRGFKTNLLEEVLSFLIVNLLTHSLEAQSLYLDQE